MRPNAAEAESTSFAAGVGASTSILYSKAGAVARIRLNRPAAGNALDLELVRAFFAAVRDADADETIRVISISAGGKLFCGGGDLAAVSSAEQPAAYMAELASTFHGALELLTKSSCIVVAIQQGSAAGGGLGLLLACDYVIASASVSYSSAYALVGLTPDSGVSYLLPRVIGHRHANEMCLFGRVIDAPTALDWGLIDKVVAPESLDAAGEAVVEHLTSSAIQILGDTKRLLLAAPSRSFSDHLADEATTIAAFTGQVDSAARIRAFVERRR
ncbi:MAG: hypothetical protein JWQ19_3831 [Subtercola sp.]|nr:hypothetical protein [Subtercola sp.]